MSIVSEATLKSVGEDCTVFPAVRNRTASENLKLQSETVPERQSRQLLCLDQSWSTELTKILYLLWNMLIILLFDLVDTSTEFTSFAQNFLSSTGISEEGLSENEKRARTDPQLLKPVPGPDLSSVLSFWWEGARDQLAEDLNEYDDLFMKHKADIGRCTIAKHRIELEPEPSPTGKVPGVCSPTRLLKPIKK